MIERRRLSLRSDFIMNRGPLPVRDCSKSLFHLCPYSQPTAEFHPGWKLARPFVLQLTTSLVQRSVSKTIRPCGATATTCGFDSGWHVPAFFVQAEVAQLVEQRFRKPLV